jgi:tRNA(fMet)-specific endonuclease VapC
VDRALVDTDILSDILKARHQVVAANTARYIALFGHLTTSVITVMEMVKGLHKMQREDALSRLLQGLAASEVLAFDLRCAEMAGRIYGDLDRVGQPIGRADPMIAATALVHDLTLVSANTDHYQRIQALGYPLKLTN